ncbi:hypothetical protein BDW72DRAFT_173365 [Aspergillus terricola var. indicus]
MSTPASTWRGLKSSSSISLPVTELCTILPDLLFLSLPPSTLALSFPKPTISQAARRPAGPSRESPSYHYYQFGASFRASSAFSSQKRLSAGFSR